jgi:hypothetical protein
MTGISKLVIGLEIFVGIGALFGGGMLMLGPDGRLLGMPLSLLAGSPFRDFFVPGLVLFSAVGIFPLVAAVAAWRRLAVAPLLAAAVGLALMGWIAVEMVILAGTGSLAWSLYLILGTGIFVLGAVWWRSREAGK